MRAAVTGLLALAACSSPSSADCLVVSQTASDRLEARLEFHRQGCGSNADCTLTPLSISCFSGCPSAVLASQKDDAASELAALDTSICGGTACQISIGCDPKAAACISGFCRTVDAGALDAGAPDAGAPDAGSGDAGP